MWVICRHMYGSRSQVSHPWWVVETYRFLQKADVLFWSRSSPNELLAPMEPGDKLLRSTARGDQLLRGTSSVGAGAGDAPVRGRHKATPRMVSSSGMNIASLFVKW